MIFDIGDMVEHKIFGKGIVQKSDKNSTQVLFENNNEIKQIKNEFLIFVNIFYL